MPRLTLTQFNDWLDAYGEAWIEGNPTQIVGLFDADARYHVTPFDEPLVGHEAIRRYWEAGPRDAHQYVRFSHDVIAVAGEIGVARWHATFLHVAAGHRIELDGVFVAEFDADGCCTVLREWWHKREGTGD